MVAGRASSDNRDHYNFSFNGRELKNQFNGGGGLKENKPPPPLAAGFISNFQWSRKTPSATIRHHWRPLTLKQHLTRVKR